VLGTRASPRGTGPGPRLPRRRRPAPRAPHLITLFGRFYLDLFEVLIRWADLAEAEIAAWPDTADLGMTNRTRALLEEALTRLEVLADRAAEQSAPGSGVT